MEIKYIFFILLPLLCYLKVVNIWHIYLLYLNIAIISVKLKWHVKRSNYLLRIAIIWKTKLETCPTIRLGRRCSIIYHWNNSLFDLGIHPFYVCLVENIPSMLKRYHFRWCFHFNYEALLVQLFLFSLKTLLNAFLYLGLRVLTPRKFDLRSYQQ